MYQGLHTNLPKEIMHYPDFPFSEQDKSYLSSQEVLEYFQSYADTFNLKSYIKFEYHVQRVRPLLDDSWEVIVKDLKSDKYETLNFDAVFVANGHYNTPLIPNYEGKKIFEGLQMHSHDYRSPEMFRNESVLIIGGGPSAKDSVFAIQHVAAHVTWSHHLKKPPVTAFCDNVIQRKDVKKITKDGAIFIDESYQKFSVILYCTGYRYTFPFLSVDCGLSVNNNLVEPLYKHCLNINRPTLAIIGLPNYICPSPMFDLQARFCLTFLTGRKQLPSLEEMMKDLENDKKIQLIEREMPKKKFHNLGVGFDDKYYESMALAASIDPIKPVIPKMFAKGLEIMDHDCVGFRNQVFKVIDDENFITISK